MKLGNGKLELRSKAFGQLAVELDKITDNGLSDLMLEALTEGVMRMLEGAYCEGRRDQIEEEKRRCQTIQ